MTPGHTLSISGNAIIIDPARDDEGIWLEKRLHVTSRHHSYTKVARGRIVKSDIALAEVIFDEAVPKGTYLLTLYTRSGRGTDFKVIHCRSEVSVKQPTYASRTYKVFGKVDLSDSVWLEVNDNVELYRFFKVIVEIK